MLPMQQKDALLTWKTQRFSLFDQQSMGKMATWLAGEHVEQSLIVSDNTPCLMSSNRC